MNLDLIGNLGQDAQLRTDNGRSYVLFSVANTERFQRRDGSNVEITDWVNCILNGDGGQLLQYLKKGRKVYVRGRASLRVFSSEKDRRMKAGVDLNVKEVELLEQANGMPRNLYKDDGVMVRVNTAYWVAKEDIPANGILFDVRNNMFNVDNNGWVTAAPSANAGEKTNAESEKQNAQSSDQNTDNNVADDIPF